MDSASTHTHTTQKKPLCFFAVDIEATGASLFTDRCFAIGVVGGQCLHEYKSFNACVDLHKSSDITWREHWFSSGFEKDCFDSFWSKFKPTLDLLQDPKQVNLHETEGKMIESLNTFLGILEQEYEKIVLVTDTTCFDTVWVTYLLQKHGYPGLAYTRAGEYRRGGSFELDSFRVGVYDVNPVIEKVKPWEDDQKYTDALTSPHDHHPEHDALHIYQSWMAAMEANQRRRSTSNKERGGKTM